MLFRSVEDVELLEPVTRQLGLVLDNIRCLQQAEISSLLDSLTGLYSHRYFYEALKREIDNVNAVVKSAHIEAQ